jgi:hypothetical protein
LRGCVESREARRLVQVALKKRRAEMVPGGACPPPGKNGRKVPDAEKNAPFLLRNRPLSLWQLMF